MSVRLTILEQDIAMIPPETVGRLTTFTGAIALNTLVVVGLQHPRGETLRAAGYDFVGDEDRGTAITLSDDEADRLLEAYDAAMIHKQPLVHCDSVVDYTKGWRVTPGHVPAQRFQSTRIPERALHATPLDQLRDGTAYDFVSGFDTGDPHIEHAALGINDPTRNLAKLGDEPMVTMHNIDTVQHYRGTVPVEVYRSERHQLRKYKDT